MGMTDKEFNATKKRIKKYFEKWRYQLGINWWKVTLNYSRVPLEDVNGIKGPLATNETSWQYGSVSLAFDCVALFPCSNEDVEDTVVHELLHAIVNEMRDFDRGRPDSIKHEERVVTNLTDAMLRIKKGK